MMGRGPGDVRGRAAQGPARTRDRGERFSEFTYIYQSLVRRPARYVMTVSALSLCVIFFIVVASLALGLQEELEGGLETDEPEPGSEGTSIEDIGPKSAELVTLEEDVKTVMLSWLYVTSVLLFITSGTTVATTMLLNVKQRQREIGILKAVGFSDGQVQRLFLYEALWLSGAAFIVGVLVGTTLAANVFNPLYNEGAGGMFFAPARTPPVIILSAFILTFLTGGLATWYPAKRAAGLDPVEAMAA